MCVYYGWFSGKMRQGGEDTIRWREKRRWRPCVEFLMADLPIRDLDLYTRPFRRWKILVQPRKQSKSIDNRFLIIIFRHTRLFPLSFYFVVSHIAGFFMQIPSSLFLSKTGRLEPTSIDRRPFFLLF